MQVALNKVLAELNKQTRREPNDEDPLTLPTFAATSAPASQVSAGDGVVSTAARSSNAQLPKHPICTLSFIAYEFKIMTF